MLHLTALQNGMMQLLPGGCQRYVRAAAGHAVDHAAVAGHSWEQEVEQQIIQAYSFGFALCWSLELTYGDVPAEQQLAPALQAAAVHMMLELQLVAAGLLQRQWQQGEKAAARSVDLVLMCCRMLELQIRAVLQGSASNSLPLELLQQTGLQLLRALAAPVQQLQLLMTHQQQQTDGISGTQAINVDEVCATLQSCSDIGLDSGSPIGQVLYLLGAAASGLAARDNPHGKLVVVCKAWCR
jgi:hypothetical protein